MFRPTPLQTRFRNLPTFQIYPKYSIAFQTMPFNFTMKPLISVCWVKWRHFVLLKNIALFMKFSGSKLLSRHECIPLYIHYLLNPFTDGLPVADRVWKYDAICPNIVPASYWECSPTRPPFLPEKPTSPVIVSSCSSRSSEVSTATSRPSSSPARTPVSSSHSSSGGCYCTHKAGTQGHGWDRNNWTGYSECVHSRLAVPRF